jgi:predicted nucleic acid-binding protein
MRKLRIYLDTSVLNFYYAEDSPKEMAITRQLFTEIADNLFEAFISAVVIDEVEAAEEAIRHPLTNLIITYDLKILETDPEVDYLAQKYIENKIIPPKYGRDAYHIAYTTIYELDLILSWNYEHIVKLKTKTGVNGINKLEGYREIEICSPWEVVKSE